MYGSYTPAAVAVSRLGLLPTVDRLITGLDHCGDEMVEKKNPAKGRCLPIPVSSQRRIRSKLSIASWNGNGVAAAQTEPGYAPATALPTRLVPEQSASSQIRGNP